ncbi:hypothetical protein DW352_05295 [Pseudolabrys taiwanensis]|uniref:Uncharacterized protein n=1 Tax=Pseudolabrys taiwanensis TaxID=331696 RepID=A0A345ZST8_9HYPH|nr:hypothetical protein [Pseudolabrys taiwanensis]AXK79985.1 hypothetical protein DW352_05295 [Pseudolabrys taiwanensis]
MSQPSPDDREIELHAIDIVRDILARAGTLPRLMEVHYLMQEPDLFEIVRCMTALPDKERAKLLQFFEKHGMLSRLRVREVGGRALHLEYDKQPLQRTVQAITRVL